MLTSEIKQYIDKSVLCWLATSDSDNEPNVTPKEVFTYRGENTLLIAHIASPNSVKNIKQNPKVCVSFIDVFVQKGFKIKGIAQLIKSQDNEFHDKVRPLTDMVSDKIPIKSVIEIDIKKVEPILAPSYFLFPDTTEKSQIENAMATYKVKPV